MLSVEVRCRTSVASCGDEIKKGERYMIIHGEYRGHQNNVSFCRKCGLEKISAIKLELDNDLLGIPVMLGKG